MPVKAPARESAIYASVQRDWLERKLQELRKEAEV